MTSTLVVNFLLTWYMTSTPIGGSQYPPIQTLIFSWHGFFYCSCSLQLLSFLVNFLLAWCRTSTRCGGSQYPPFHLTFSFFSYLENILDFLLHSVPIGSICIILRSIIWHHPLGLFLGFLILRLFFFSLLFVARICSVATSPHIYLVTFAWCPRNPYCGILAHPCLVHGNLVITWLHVLLWALLQFQPLFSKSRNFSASPYLLVSDLCRHSIFLFASCRHEGFFFGSVEPLLLLPRRTLLPSRAARC